ncbi:TonB family protein [Amphibiibacter pelophylacis]|uniref:TonB family protein n=1 Tax=Amphibiibacter pelophylacis TaxID=1799477 RepID=A0ACC6P378_9BURK
MGAQGLKPRWRPSGLHKALAVSLALHALVLTLRWVTPPEVQDRIRDRVMDVILLNAESDEKPPADARTLAQSNLAGGGEAEAGRATSILPASTTSQSGDAIEDERRRVLGAMRQEQQMLLTQIRRELAMLPVPTPEQLSGNPQAQAAEEMRLRKERMLAELEKRINAQNIRPRKRYISPSTREDLFAVYYARMRRRIEDEGTRNFPQDGGRKLYGALTINVTTDAVGKVVEAQVIKSSGNPVLDRKALQIVYASAPFDRFSAAMSAQTDQIVITSRFHFTRDEGLNTQMQAPVR